MGKLVKKLCVPALQASKMAAAGWREEVRQHARDAAWVGEDVRGMGWLLKEMCEEHREGQGAYSRG